MFRELLSGLGKDPTLERRFPENVLGNKNWDPDSLVLDGKPVWLRDIQERVEAYRATLSPEDEVKRKKLDRLLERIAKQLEKGSAN